MAIDNMSAYMKEYIAQQKSHGVHWGREKDFVWNPKITRLIWTMYRNGTRSLRELGEIFGCSHMTIRKILLETQNKYMLQIYVKKIKNTKGGNNETTIQETKENAQTTAR